MKLSSITAVLVQSKKDENNPEARVSNSIHVSIPELGWDSLKFRPSVLAEVIELYRENEMMDEDNEEKETSFAKFSRQLKSLAEPFYSSRQMDWDGFAAVLQEVAPIIDSLEPASVADPLLSAKRYAAKNVKVAAATETVDYLAVIRTALDREIADLNAIYAKAQTVDAATFASFIQDKANANGVDDQGYAKLRSKKAAE